MEKKVINLLKTVVFIYFTVVFFMYAIHWNIQYKNLKFNYKCAVGTLNKKWTNGKGHPFYLFSFYANNKLYRIERDYDERWDIKIGEKFWVKYLPSDPTVVKWIPDENGVIIKTTDSLSQPKVCECEKTQK
jgi:hypothetical protein